MASLFRLYCKAKRLCANVYVKQQLVESLELYEPHLSRKG